MSVVMTREQVLRAQLDQAMRTQEQLAENINTGLLEIRRLRAELATLQAHVHELEAAVAVLKMDGGRP